MKRKQIHPRKKYNLKKLHNFTCFNCKRVFPSDELEIDHWKPLCNSLDNSKDNLIPLCIDCHNSKTHFEWKNGTYLNKSHNKLPKLTPKKKLELLKSFLKKYKDCSYPEILFMVLNNPSLNCLEYNTTVLKLLLNELKGKKKEKSVFEVKYKSERDLLVRFIKKKIGLSYRELQKELNTCGISLSHVQLKNICTKKD